MSLDKTAFRTYRLLPEETKASYHVTVDALKSRFKPVDIVELRGMEFHQLVQNKQSIEELGLELQKLATRAFPMINGKDFDRLLKGRFFQALLPRWQRKLGAPKPEEFFEELFARARIMKRREEQYTAISNGRNEPRHKNSNSGKQPTQPASEGSGQSPTETRRQNQGNQCRACHRFRHIAKFCKNRQRRGGDAEASGRAPESNANVVTPVTQCSSAELEEELSKRRLEGEQELCDAHLTTNVQVMSGAFGPSYWL